MCRPLHLLYGIQEAGVSGFVALNSSLQRYERKRIQAVDKLLQAGERT